MDTVDCVIDDWVKELVARARRLDSRGDSMVIVGLMLGIKLGLKDGPCAETTYDRALQLLLSLTNLENRHLIAAVDAATASTVTALVESFSQVKQQEIHT